MTPHTRRLTSALIIYLRLFRRACCRSCRRAARPSRHDDAGGAQPAESGDGDAPPRGAPMLPRTPHSHKQNTVNVGSGGLGGSQAGIAPHDGEVMIFRFI